MKSLIFKEAEYHDLNTLMIAFAQEFNEAMKVIHSKSFLRFTKKFKGANQTVREILYSTKYLQNALSFLIYHFTEAHLIVVQGHHFADVDAFISAYKQDPALFCLFIEEHGITRTFLKELTEEHLKLNFQTLERHQADVFAQKVIISYEDYDEIENIETLFHPLYLSTEEMFKTARELFLNEENQIFLAHKFSLEEVLVLRNKICPVFYGLQMIQGYFETETLKRILDTGYHIWILDHLKQYKWKSKNAKQLYKKLSVQKSLFLKLDKSSATFTEYVTLHEQVYNLYLELVQLFVLGEVKTNVLEYELNGAYCATFIPKAYMEHHPITLQPEEVVVETSTNQNYNLKKLEKAVRNHKHFARWTLLFGLLLLAYALVSLIPDLYVAISNPDNLFLASDLFYYTCVGSVILFAVFIMINNKIHTAGYYKLCKLAYYRNNSQELTSKELKHFEQLELQEGRLAKKIDRFYRFYGAFAMFFLAYALTMVINNVTVQFLSNISFFEHADKIFSVPYLYMSFIPAGLCFVNCLCRHKKTAFSCLLSVLYSCVLSFGLLYLISSVF